MNHFDTLNKYKIYLNEDDVFFVVGFLEVDKDFIFELRELFSDLIFGSVIVGVIEGF